MGRHSDTDLLDHHRRLTARIAPRVGHAEAEDLASEALTRALRRPPPDGRSAPWIERILHNLAVDHARTHRRHPTVPLDPSATVCDAPSPEQRLIDRERVQALADAMTTVPDVLRGAALRRFVDGVAYVDIASDAGVTVNTVRTRVHRALAHLRRKLDRLVAIFPMWSSAGASHVAGPGLSAALAMTLVLPSLHRPGPPNELAAVPAIPAHARLSQARRPRDPIANQPAGGTAAPAQPANAEREPNEPTTDNRGDGRRPDARSTDRLRHGESQPSESKPSTPSNVGIRRFAFEDDDIVGDLKRPYVDVDTSVTGATHPSLIEVPREFIGATAKMLEDL